MNRREFLKRTAAASAAASFPGVGFTQANNGYQFDDYKALVLVFLYGGNDAYNTMIPMGNSTARGFSSYSDIRRVLAVNDNNFDINNFRSNGRLDLASKGNPWSKAGMQPRDTYLNGYFDTGAGFGFNSLMPELADLYDRNQLAMMSNIGPMIEPTSRKQMLSKTAKTPQFLFAHDHQLRFIQSAQQEQLRPSGWAGRVADRFNASGSTLQTGMSFVGNRLVLNGDKTAPMALAPGRPPAFQSTAGRQRGASRRRDLLTSMNQAKHTSIFSKHLAETQQQQYNLHGDLMERYADSPSFKGLTDSYGEALFARGVPRDKLEMRGKLNGGFIHQLESTARWISVAEKDATVAPRRQIYVVGMSGYDTHNEQIMQHPNNVRELSLGLWKFQEAMNQLGLADKVTTMTVSDFGRSMSNNGDGTDHGWASHQLVMGGAVNGGNRFGELPDLRLGGTQDSGSKGRIIPDTSYDQLFGTACNWMGMKQRDIAEIFPYLSNFEKDKGDLSSAFIDGLLG